MCNYEGHGFHIFQKINSPCSNLIFRQVSSQSVCVALLDYQKTQIFVKISFFVYTHTSSFSCEFFKSLQEQLIELCYFIKSNISYNSRAGSFFWTTFLTTELCSLKRVRHGWVKFLSFQWNVSKSTVPLVFKNKKEELVPHYELTYLNKSLISTSQHSLQNDAE